MVTKKYSTVQYKCSAIQYYTCSIVQFNSVFWIDGYTEFVTVKGKGNYICIINNNKPILLVQLVYEKKFIPLTQGRDVLFLNIAVVFFNDSVLFMSNIISTHFVCFS